MFKIKSLNYMTGAILQVMFFLIILFNMTWIFDIPYALT